MCVKGRLLIKFIIFFKYFNDIDVVGCRLKVNIRECSIFRYFDDKDVFLRGGSLLIVL